jgi:hypothetical protein
MNTEQQRQQAEDRRERAEDGRQHTEKQRDSDEHKRQMAEKQREVGEQLRNTERTGERLIMEYSTRTLLTRIEGFEERVCQLESRLESVEVLLRTIHEHLHQLLSEKE